MNAFWDGFEKAAGSIGIKAARRALRSKKRGVEKMDKYLKNQHKKLVRRGEHALPPTDAAESAVFYEPVYDALARAAATQRKGGFRGAKGV